jgi:hypothetical protein
MELYTSFNRDKILSAATMKIYTKSAIIIIIWWKQNSSQWRLGEQTQLELKFVLLYAHHKNKMNDEFMDMAYLRIKPRCCNMALGDQW